MGNQSQSCFPKECPQHCNMTKWAIWQPCNAGCGNGTQGRSRSIITLPNQYGDSCEAEYEQRPCEPALPACQQHCTMHKWQNWQGCNAACGNGTDTRIRTQHRAILNGGNAC